MSSLRSHPHIVILMGVMGSGKTTIGQLLSSSLGWKHFDADDFHHARNLAKMKRGIPLDDADREPWLGRLRQVINDLLETNERAVLSCSALKESYRDLLLIDGRVQLVYLKATPTLIRQRIKDRRGHYMNPILVKSQFATLEEPSDCLQIDVSNPPREIVAAIKEHFRLGPSNS